MAPTEIINKKLTMVAIIKSFMTHFDFGSGEERGVAVATEPETGDS